MGKMNQITHRLVGLIQVLEWSWKIVKEYLTINECFTGIISIEFISDVQRIFNRCYQRNNNDSCCFTAEVSSVQHAINISEALLEQYKVLMRLPDDMNRTNHANSTNLKVNVCEREIGNQKLEKTKNKMSVHARAILLFKSVMFTPSTLYKTADFKHHSENVNLLLNDLLDVGLLVAFKDGIVSTTKKAIVYVKWFPSVNDDLEYQRFEQMLSKFNDNEISADSVIKSTTVASLFPHKAVIRPIVLQYLKSNRYNRLHLKFDGNFARNYGNYCMQNLSRKLKYEILCRSWKYS